MEGQIELIARGVLLRGQYILLCQNTARGYWYLPGGHVEFGEAAAAALAREIQEEAGLEIRAGACVLVTEGSFRAKRRHHEINLVFRVEELGDTEAEVACQEEGIAFGWFDLASLTDLDLRPASVKAWLVSGGRPAAGVEACAWVSEIGPVQ